MPGDPGKADAEMLINELLPFAERMLREHGEFLPFGGRITAEGEVIWEGATTGEKRSPSPELIEILRTEHRRLATQGAIRACATLYDVRVVPPDREVKQDAVAVELDCVSGYSVIVYFPYRVDSVAHVQIDPPFANAGNATIFVDGHA